MDSFNEAFFNTDVEITIEEVMPRSPSPPQEEKTHHNCSQSKSTRGAY